MAVALVLGGGGVTGVAWTIGALAGLVCARALDLADVTCFVGTSAGSVVASRIAAGHALDDLVDEESTIGAPAGFAEYFTAVDRAVTTELFGIWSTTERMTPDVARTIGELAARAAPQDPAEWVAGSASRLQGAAWGEVPTSIVTVDAETGERVAWNAEAGQELTRVVAASCAVPGLIPPIEIDGRRYIDGGVWSSTNADLVLGASVDRVLVTCPQAGGGLLQGASLAPLERERAALEADGRTVVVVSPGPDYAAFGIDHMNARTRRPALEIGLRDGAEAAPHVANAILGG